MTGIQKSLCTIILLWAIPTVAQEQKITFARQSVSAREAIAEIKDQTGCYFAISHAHFDDNRIIYFPKSILTLREALDQLISGTDQTYQIKGKQILILTLNNIKQEDKKAARTPQPVAQREITRHVPFKEYEPVQNRDFEQDVMEYIPQLVKPSKKQEEATAPLVTAVEKKQQEEITDSSTATDKSYTYPPVRTTITYTQKEADRWKPEKIRTQPVIGVKTNVLYGAAALAPNIALETGLSRKTSLEISAAWNPWHKDNAEKTKKMAHLIVKPEFRYWLCERFNGHFFGVHPFYWDYNVSGKKIPLLFDKEYRYEGNAFGIGASYGYHWMWNKHWGMEFNVGVGASFMKYKKFEAEECGEMLGDFKKKYFGPTSAGIKIMYMIK